jgi:hypothetical protein
MEVILFAPCIALLLAPIAGLVYLLYIFCFMLPLETYRWRKLQEAYAVAKPLADAYYAKPEDERTPEEAAALGKARAEYNKRVHKHKAYTADRMGGLLIEHPGFYQLSELEKTKEFLKHCR